MATRLPRGNGQIGRLTNANLATYCQTFHDGLLAQAVAFPTPPIPLTVFQTDINAYNTALAASIGGSMAQRHAMQAARVVVEQDLRANMQYLNQVVTFNINNGDTYASQAALITATGAQLGRAPNPIGPIGQAVIKKFNSPAPGQLYVLVIKLHGARTYSLVWGITGTPMSGWTTDTYGGTRILKTGLASGTSITFGVQGNGTSGITTLSTLETQIII